MRLSIFLKGGNMDEQALILGILKKRKNLRLDSNTTIEKIPQGTHIWGVRIPGKEKYDYIELTETVTLGIQSYKYGFSSTANALAYCKK
jgi:hypothetical protein